MEIPLKQKNIVIATTATTYTANNPLRINLARKMFEEANRLHYMICCVECTEGEVENLLFGKPLPNVIRIPSGLKTTGEDRRKAIAKAMEIAGDHGFWAWVEPERIDFVKTIPFLLEPILQGKADIVVPERSEECWNQLHSAQWMSEKAINQIWEIFTHTRLDIACGPKLGNRAAGQYFLQYKGNYGDIWDSTNCPLQYMLADGLRIANRQWNFLYPKEQVEIEIETPQLKEKRLLQFTNLAKAIHYCSLDSNFCSL